jgi:hypothetical protein
MARDDFPSRAKLQLALRVNYRCSNPNCRASTSGPKLAPGASISIGVDAHITAASKGGPRFKPGLRSQDRSSAENGIWLCQNCGKLVDNDEVRFPEVLLREWKSWAEAEAREQLGKQASDLAFVTVLDSIHGQLRRESNCGSVFRLLIRWLRTARTRQMEMGTHTAIPRTPELNYKHGVMP